ncbi:MAG: hypothetical protein ACYSWU_25970, partial [Planctomycetota bacterium]
MHRLALPTIVLLLLCLLAASATAAQPPRSYVVTPELARAIEAAAPDKAPVKPARPRKVLVYGRLPTHPESVACCFTAMEILGRKSGAFQTLLSGDPVVFARGNLDKFDAVVMN